MNFRKTTLSALLVLAACAGQQKETMPTPPPAPAVQPAPAPAPDAFRAQKPAPLPVAPNFQAPVPEERQLKNGLTLLVVTNKALPLVSVDLLVKTGVDGEPKNKAGIADFVASTLDEGTRTKTALQVAEAFENVAARFSASAGLDASRLHLNSLKETLPQALDVMADVAMNPAFRAKDVERVRSMLRNDLLQKQSFPSALAYDEMAKQLYGPNHPWGQPSGGTLKTLAGITRADLGRFHDTWYRPNNAVISFVGDITADEAQTMAEAKLGKWKQAPVPKVKLPALPQPGAQHVVLVPAAHASQSQVWTGTPLAIKASDPAAVPLKVANYPLGGLFTSRLNLNLREQHGYSYGVFSRLSFDKFGGALVAMGGIVAKDTAPAVQEYEKELTRFSDGKITEEELDQGKNAYIRSLPSVLETNDAVASAVNGLVLQGLPLDFYQTLPAKVMAVSAADVQQVVNRYVKPTAWPIVVAGPAEVQGELQQLNLGTVTVDHPDAEATSASAPVKKAAAAQEQKPSPHGGMLTKQKQEELQKHPRPIGSKPTGKE